MAGLPGVKVGPLDPDATSGFGQVAARNSARQLIRLHRQMYPAHLRRALARPMDEPHTKAAKEGLEEIREHLSGLTYDNGDPLIPEGARVVDAAVRGDKSTGRILTYQFQLPSGRIGKGYTEYAEEHLPDVFAEGAELSRVKEMKDRGVVAFDSEGHATETLRRQNASLRNEVTQLRDYIKAGGEADLPDETRGVDTRDSVNLADENERLGRELQELREENARFRALQEAGGGGFPTAGLAEDLERGGGGEDGASGEDPPFEGYEQLRADELCSRIKAEDTSLDEVRAILEYERGHADRKSVVGAAEQRLDTAG